ncbi:MAG: coaE, partial [Marmoricola sp.]|nr:coaE [Marmoricola sp.]
FGTGLLTAEGDLDRPAMGTLVFGNEAARKRLEAIVHPLVFERIVDLEVSAPEGSLVVHDIPLLAESGRADTFDSVLVVHAPSELQIERMVRDRCWTEEEARSRMAAQAAAEERLAIATHVIDNTGTLEDLRRRVTEVFEELVGRGGSIAATGSGPGFRQPGRGRPGDAAWRSLPAPADGRARRRCRAWCRCRPACAGDRPPVRSGT